jgi:hypothetical protein
MNTVFMKIVGFDEPSNSLLVSFASDETNSQNPEDYAPLAFQPATMWPGVDDVADITKRIAVAGMYNVSVQATMEKLSADTARINALKSLVGQTSSFAVSDLQMPLDAPTDPVTVV